MNEVTTVNEGKDVEQPKTESAPCPTPGSASSVDATFQANQLKKPEVINVISDDPVVEAFLRLGMFVYEMTGEKLIVTLQRSQCGNPNKTLFPYAAVELLRASTAPVNDFCASRDLPSESVPEFGVLSHPLRGSRIVPVEAGLS